MMTVFWGGREGGREGGEEDEREGGRKQLEGKEVGKRREGNESKRDGCIRNTCTFIYAVFLYLHIILNEHSKVGNLFTPVKEYYCMLRPNCKLLARS